MASSLLSEKMRTTEQSHFSLSPTPPGARTSSVAEEVGDDTGEVEVNRVMTQSSQGEEERQEEQEQLWRRQLEAEVEQEELRKKREEWRRARKQDERKREEEEHQQQAQEEVSTDTTHTDTSLRTLTHNVQHTYSRCLQKMICISISHA